MADSLMDVWKHAVFVHDITSPAYLKSGQTAKDLFRTLTTGLDGTPMESYVHLPEEDRWALVHFIRSRFVKELKKAEFETDLYSYKVDSELNTDVNSPVWEGVKTTELVLRPLSSRRGAVETINFASVNNGEQLAIRLRWEDPTKNDFKDIRQDYFKDGVAVQFALGSVTLHTHGHNEPFFGMGNRGKIVNIWHWKAGRAEAVQAEDDMEYAGGVDMDALIYGGMRSNPVASLTSISDSEVQELNAEGFGTVTPQPEDKQNVDGHGEWKDGVWTVVLVRDMVKVGEWDVNLVRKDSALTAFAVWDGQKEDRNGRKVISVWQRLNILTENPVNSVAKR
ncbi:MAG: ethylbenzene dehydrogenase-related protein, partial [Nitrospinales bacterium]